MDNNLPHIILPIDPQEMDFVSSRQRGPKNSLRSNLKEHCESLVYQFNETLRENEEERKDSNVRGGYFLFDYPASDNQITSVDSRKIDCRICNTKSLEDGKTNETVVHIPFQYASKIEEKFSIFLTEKRTKSGKHCHERLVNSIEKIGLPKLEQFWMSDTELLPGDSPVWIEFWIRDNSNNEPERNDLIGQTQVLLDSLSIDYNPNPLYFPERIVYKIRANRKNMDDIRKNSDDLAEFRIASTTTATFTEMKPSDQRVFSDELLQRISVVHKQDPVCVCLLDNGVTQKHPLISKVMAKEDCQTIESSLDVTDSDCCHGTAVAGLCAYGNLTESLESSQPIQIQHVLESVKILSKKPYDNELFGNITKKAVSLSEEKNPERKRVFCSTITTEDSENNGTPTSWSSTFDALAFDSQLRFRLFVQSIGNTFLGNGVYPLAQQNQKGEDPAQAWNVITVGAYTQLTNCSEAPNADIVAPCNGISPFTSTSLQWNKEWPFKPDVLFEGGNQYWQGDNALDCESLSLLTTNNNYIEKYFCSFNMTSASAALAANFAAKIVAQYPEFWSETIRGLIIHSASWTEEMKSSFLESKRKEAYKKILRICGFGVPELRKALSCGKNSLTMIKQAEIQPFVKSSSNSWIFNKLHLYDLPWPKEDLLKLGEKTVKVRITLSYYIDPSPGNVCNLSRYRYTSHGLCFDIKHSAETEEAFIKRINKKEDQSQYLPNRENHWLLGPTIRKRGSIQSDIWTGTASELANCNQIAVMPTNGWWKERPWLNKGDSRTRYSLIVSLFTEDVTLDVDFYTPVLNQIKLLQPIATDVFI